MAQRYLGLDGLRGVCALTVLFFHLHLFSFGYYVVDTFFILSGFVLSLRYEKKLQSGSWEWRFVRHRIQTLFPVFWMGTAVSAACIFFSGAYLLMGKVIVPEHFLRGWHR